MRFVPTDRSVLVVPPTDEPLSVDQVKLRAGQDWPPGDPRDALLEDYIAAARDWVERYTGLALVAQTRDAFAEISPSSGVFDVICGVQLGSICVPVQTITSVSTVGADGTLTLVDPAAYNVDLARGRIGWAPAAGTPGSGIVVRVVAGWLTPDALAAAAPGLVQAVGLLAVHYFTVGRDVVNLGQSVADVPYGLEETLAPYRQVSLI